MKEKATGRYYLLVNSKLILGYLSHIPDPSVENGTTHSGLDASTLINTQDNPPQAWPQVDLIWAVIPLRLPSYVSLGYVKMTYKG